MVNIHETQKEKLRLTTLTSRYSLSSKTTLGLATLSLYNFVGNITLAVFVHVVVYMDLSSLHIDLLQTIVRSNQHMKHTYIKGFMGFI